jgi:hypothetical protein
MGYQDGMSCGDEEGRGPAGSRFARPLRTRSFSEGDPSIGLLPCRLGSAVPL